MVELWITEDDNTAKIVFTGDMGNLNQPIVKDPSIIENCDYLVMDRPMATVCTDHLSHGLMICKRLLRIP
jgi:Cft2 family RNA processing exonuclease